MKTQRWQRYLTELIEPFAFLAVPHHVDERAYWELVEGDGKAVVDRPRLAKKLKQVSAELLLVIDAILAVEVRGIEV